ncbi:alpha/beta hydrolase [Chryseomicrobium sp. FSL W7-1435]|uniref:alpha/beta fold hydrolase n=1 Tax=Chryseomicrobium sp. FSL W7-1435 TaxID=2921704 RepID=UPI00315A2E42
MGKWIEVEQDVKVFVEDIGQGDPVVFIHGWPLSNQSFEGQISAIAENGFRYIGIDLRGLGKSDRPWSAYDYDMAASDLDKVVTSLGLTNFVLGGFSMGGPIAIRYITNFGADKVKHLLLMGAAAPRFTQTEGFEHGMKPEEVDDIIANIEKDRPGFINEFSGMFFAKDHSDSFIKWFQSLALESSAHGTIGYAKALRDEDLQQETKALTLPVTLFHGAKDEICPIELSHWMNEHIENSTLVTFEESGHGMYVDEKDKFNEELVKLLKS